MQTLETTLADTLCRRFDAFLDQSRALCAGLSDRELWTRPYAYGNSVGHLLLHVTGNLNYYIGANIANTAYVRHRDMEFADPAGRAKADVLDDLAASVAMVTQTIRAQSSDDWSRPYSAVGTDETLRLGIVIRCTHHFHHHLGQIIYLVKEHGLRRGQ